MRHFIVSGGLLCAGLLSPVSAMADFPAGYHGTPFKGPHILPCVLEAEDFDEGGEGISWHDATSTNQGSDYRPNCNVDIERHYSIGFTENGEWLNYTLEVPQSGCYTVRVYCCGPNGNGSFHLELDGTPATRALAVPVTSDWGDFSQYVEAELQLSAGKHLLKWYTYGGMNLDKFEFIRTGDYTPGTLPGELSYPITRESHNPLFVNFDSPMYGSSGIGTMWTADPSAHVWHIDGRDVLYVYASHDMEPAQGCDRMDRYHVFSTEDMVNWTDHGEILGSADVPWGRPEGGFMWAPDCAYRNGTYYFYFPHPSGSEWNTTWKIGVATSTEPASGFKVQGYIEGMPAEIDPCVFIDDDGQAYIYNGGGGRCYGGRLKSNMTELDGVMSEMKGLVDFHEGAWVHKRNGRYYLSYADNHGTDGNQLRYAVSESPLGPWEVRDAYLFATGCDTSHGSIVEYKGKWYAFYHTSNYSGTGLLRSVCFDELEYDAAGDIKPVHNWGTPSSPGGPFIIGLTPLTIDARGYNDGGYHYAWFRKNRGEVLTGSEGGHSYVAGMQGGEWLRYSVDVENPERYDISVTVRPRVNDSRLHVSVNGTDRTGTLSPANGSGWQTLSATGVRLGATAEYLDLRVDNGSLDIASISITPAEPYKGSPYHDHVAVPGIIEAEDFDLGGEGVGFYNGETGNQQKWTDYRTDAAGKTVDMERSTDLNTENHSIRREYIALNWMNDSKWFNYSVKCDEPGHYTAKVMVANQQGARGTVKLTVGDRQYTSEEFEGKGWTYCGKVEVPEKIYLERGTNPVELRSGMNVDYMEFAKANVDTGMTSPGADEPVPVIRGVRGAIRVSGCTGTTEVYTPAGTCIVRAAGEDLTIGVAPGLYVIRAGRHTAKVLVK